MLNEHDGDLEGVPDLPDIVHQLRRLRGVHPCRRFVQQQQAGLCRQSPDDLQTPLGAVGQGPGLIARHVLHVEDGEQLQGPLVGLPLLPPVGGQAEDAAEGAVFGVFVEARLHVVLHRQVAEEPDVLEGAGHAHVADLDGGLPRRVPAVDHDGAPGGLVDLGQKVEHRGLPRAVGADEARDLRAANGHVEVVHRREAPEVDA